MITSIQRQKILEEEKHKGIGFTIRPVGIGDGVQFTSLPENYYKKTGQRLIDLSKPWYLDFNPYVDRSSPVNSVTELWNYPKIYEWNPPRSSVYMSNAEVHASVFGIRNPLLSRPRLYRFEEFSYDERETILFHPHGKSHGSLPDHVIDHVIKKYLNTGCLYQIGSFDEPSVGISRLKTQDLWDLTEIISKCKMLIGVDSGPAWIAACYPDVITKKIRTKFQFGYCEPHDWVALDVHNEHSFWDDLGLFKIYNCFGHDIGFTKSYREI